MMTKLCAICAAQFRYAKDYPYTCPKCSRIEFDDGIDPERQIYVRPSQAFHHWVNGRWISRAERAALIKIILRLARAA